MHRGGFVAFSSSISSPVFEVAKRDPTSAARGGPSRAAMSSMVAEFPWVLAAALLRHFRMFVGFGIRECVEGLGIEPRGMLEPGRPVGVPQGPVHQPG